MTRFFLFTIDADWVPGSERGLEALLELCRELRFRATIFTTGKFGMAYSRLIQTAHAEGHEIGVHGWEHPMPVFMGENYKFTPLDRRREWLQRATDGISEATGDRPRSFRAPYLWIDAATLPLLEHFGYNIDSSIPARRFDGLLGMVNNLGYFSASLEPYHPDPRHPGRRGSSAVLEIPPSSFLLPLNMSTLRILGLPWMLRLVGVISRRSSVLNFYCHPWEFVEQSALEFPSGVPARHRRDLGEHWVAPLKAFVQTIVERGYRPATMAEVAHCGNDRRSVRAGILAELFCRGRRAAGSRVFPRDAPSAVWESRAWRPAPIWIA